MGIFKSIGLFAIDFVKFAVTDTLQLKKYQKKNNRGGMDTDYMGVISGLNERTQKMVEDKKKEIEEYKKHNG